VICAKSRYFFIDIDGFFISGFPTKGSGRYVKHPWNLNNIARLPGSVIRRLESGISGVTVPWVEGGLLTHPPQI
jgi:hypothetical protein